LRSFGLSVGGVLAAIGTLGLVRGWGLAVLWPGIAGAGALLVALGLVAPAWLRPVHAGWMRMAHAVGWFNTRILLGLVYYGMVLPIGLVRRCVADPLALRPGSADSYWVRRDPVSDPGAYRRQV
jgi:hypothetical protein